ncbi:type I-E CRISPR-associated protein Cse2/CasB, partial [Streptomyces sp. NPDC002812]|uniref:type I-E CRISPR-associated protein Cse2/CasB n=1 Tax=Streptomyces sp. NPDC002812 TaxID=3154434 RepID=UPI0033253B86
GALHLRVEAHAPERTAQTAGVRLVAHAGAAYVRPRLRPYAAAVASGGQDGMRESAAEDRLNLLTRQSINGLHRHLPAAVRQLCGKKCPPDWAQLLVDLRAWPRDRGRIGRRWLQDFYRARRAADLEAAKKADDQTEAQPPADDA